MFRQRGMSIIGLLLGGILVIFLGITTMRVLPVYSQYYGVLQSIKGLNNLPATDFSPDPEINAQILKNSLLKRFAINDIDEKNFEAIAFTLKDDSIYEASIKYKVIKPLFANVSLLFDFNILKEVKVATH